MNRRARIAAAGLWMLAWGGAGVSRGAELLVEVRDAQGAPVADAVVHADPLGGAPPLPAAGLQAQIDQVQKEFVPRVSVVRAGTSVSFPNSDNIRHSIYSFSAAKTFATKLYSGREAPPVIFDKTGLVVLGCNIHDTMVAWLVIVDPPWFAKSDAAGNVTLKGLPDGAYRVTALGPSSNLAPGSFEVTLAGSAGERRVVTLAPGS